MARLVACALALLFVPVAAAQPGALDTTYDGDGRASAIGSGNPIRTADLAVTTKGEAVLLTARDASASRDGRVVRVTPDGALDAAFGTDGSVSLDIPGVYDIPTAVVLDDEDEIWVAGSSQLFPNEPGRLFVQRLLADGAPDPEFGGTNTTDTLPGGLALYDLGADVRTAGMARLGDVLYVAVTERAGPRCGLAALTTDGALIEAPAPIVWLSTEAACSAEALAALPGGVVVAATATAEGDDTILLAGFSPQRAIWTAFGTDGTREVDFGEGADVARSAVARDGRYLVGGYSTKGDADLGALVLAIGADGQPDASFGDGGQVWRQALPFTRTETLGLDARDGTVTFGSSFGALGQPSGAAVTRLLPTGAADLAYGDLGVSVVASSGPEDSARYRGAFVGLDPDNRAIVGGDYRPSGNSQMALAAWRLQAAVPTATDAAPTTDLALTVAPNPTASTARVRLTLDTSAPVTLAVYDVLGRRVATLHDGAAAAGDVTTTWDASTAAPGVYVIRARVGDTATTQRITVTR